MNVHPNPNRGRGIEALIESASHYRPVLPLVQPCAKSSTSADPGELWRERLPEGDEREPLILLVIDRVQMDRDEPGFCVVAPVHSSPRMASEADVVLPRPLLGFEAVVGLGCVGSVLATSLATCEGVLPQDWIDRLLAYYAYVCGRVATPPQDLVIGAPILDEVDPAFAFNDSLTERMEFIQAPAMERIYAREIGEDANEQPQTTFTVVKAGDSATPIDSAAPEAEAEGRPRGFADKSIEMFHLASASLEEPLAAAAATTPAVSEQWHLDDRVSSLLSPADNDSCYLRLESGDPTLKQLEYIFEGEPACFGNVGLTLERGSYWAEVRLPVPYGSLHARRLTLKIQA